MMKALDIYGTLFNFSIDKSLKFKTKFGGFLTLLTLGTCFIITFLFGKDFYYRTNPKVLTQEIIGERYEKKRVSNENITIAWRIEDQHGNKLDYEHLLYPRMQYFYIYLNETYKHSVVGKNFDLPIKRCNKLVQELDISFHLELNTTEWYCFDFSEFQADFGGYWNTDFLYYYSLSLETCPPEYNFLESSQPENNTFFYIDPSRNCTPKALLDEFIKQDVYLSIMFPRNIFAFDSLNNPVKKSWYNLFRRLDTVLVRYEVCEFDTVVLEDNQGWIFSEERNTSALSYLGCDQTFLYSDPSVYAENVEVYFIEFYLTRTLKFGKRNFMKIQELAAITGGFVNLMTIIIGLVSLYVNEFERHRLFADYIFKCNRDQDEKILSDFNKKFYFEKFKQKSQFFRNIEDKGLGLNEKYKNDLLGFSKKTRRKINKYFSTEKVNFIKNKSEDNNCIGSPNEFENKTHMENKNADKNLKNISKNNHHKTNDLSDSHLNDPFKQTNIIEVRSKKFNRDHININIINNNNDLIERIEENKNNIEPEHLDLHENHRVNKLEDKNIIIVDNENSSNPIYLKKEKIKEYLAKRKTSNINQIVNQKNLLSPFRNEKPSNPNIFKVSEASKLKRSLKLISVCNNDKSKLESHTGVEESLLVINNTSKRKLMDSNKRVKENNLDKINMKRINDVDKDNNENQIKVNMVVKNSKALKEFFTFTKTKETNKEYLKELMNEIDLPEILEKSKNHFSNFSFLEFFCLKFCRSRHIRNKNRLYSLFSISRLGLLGKLDIIKYLKNLLLIKIMSKLILNKEQKYYMKNYYKSLIDIEKKFDKIKPKEKEKAQNRFDRLKSYLNDVLKKDEDDISQVDHLILRNIFNIQHD